MMANLSRACQHSKHEPAPPLQLNFTLQGLGIFLASQVGRILLSPVTSSNTYKLDHMLVFISLISLAFPFYHHQSVTAFLALIKVMSDTQPTVLPLKLLELIINCLTKDDKELTTIQACSLASHTFLSQARKYIFASIKINNPFAGRWFNIEVFMTLIGHNPKISKFVQTFKSYIKDDYIMFPMLHILSKLMKLKSLTIWHPLGDKLGWNNQKWTLHPTLLHLMQLLSLTSLNLHGVKDFPISNLNHSSSLEHLVICCTYFAEEVVPPSTTPFP